MLDHSAAVRCLSISICLALGVSLCAGPVVFAAQESPEDSIWVAPTAVDPLDAHYSMAESYHHLLLPDEGPRYPEPVTGEGAELFMRALRAHEQGDRTAARAGFQQFVERFETSPLLSAALAFRAESALGVTPTVPRLQQATNLYLALLADFPTTPNGSRARWRIGDLHVQQGLQVEAKLFYERGLTESTTTYDADRSLLGLAALFMREGKWREAEEAFKRLRERSEDETLTQHATVGLADALYAQEHFQQAHTYYATSLFRWSMFLKMRTHSLLAFADTLMSLEQETAARKVYMLYYNLHRSEPEAPNVLLRVGNSFQKTGRRQQASFFYATVLAHHPHSESAIRARMRLAEIGHELLLEGGTPAFGRLVTEGQGSVYAPLTDPEEIRHTFETIAGTHPDSVLGSEALYHLARFYESRHKLAEAFHTYNTLINRVGQLLYDVWPVKGADRFATFLHPWIHAALEAGDSWTAVTLFQHLGAAREHVYAGTRMMVHLADVHRELGFTEQAITYYQAVIREAKAHQIMGEALIGLGQAYLDQKDYLAAMRVFERYRIQYPLGRWGPEAEHFLVRALHGQGETDRLIRLCQRWLVRYPRHPARPQMWLIYASALADTDRETEAMLAYEQVSKAGWLTEASHMIRYGDLLMKAGRDKAAVGWYRKALDRGTLPVEKEWARLRLTHGLFTQKQYSDTRRVLDQIQQNTEDEMVTRYVVALRDELNEVGSQ